MLKTIQISCTGSGWASPDKLQTFDKQLKTLDEKERVKLRRSIEEHGFFMPIFVWKGTTTVLDGAWRLQVVLTMLEEGYKIKGGKLPVVYVQAKDEKSAKQKILLFTSQYGKVNEKDLFEFIESADLDFDDLKLELELPEIDFNNFESVWFNDHEGKALDESIAAGLSLCTCPLCQNEHAKKE